MFITDASDRTIHVGKLRLGTVVIRNDGVCGHIIGFSENVVNELLLKVQFGDRYRPELVKSGVRTMHPGNLDIFVD